jgi:UDP-N-acetylmuramoyl-tripeptide--D-alanyl-D-alanine ligase
MEISLAQVQQATDAKPVGDVTLETIVRGWSIDSRTVAPGDLFFALRGESFNGQRALSRPSSVSLLRPRATFYMFQTHWLPCRQWRITPVAPGASRLLP